MPSECAKRKRETRFLLEQHGDFEALMYSQADVRKFTSKLKNERMSKWCKNCKVREIETHPVCAFQTPFETVGWCVHRDAGVPVLQIWCVPIPERTSLRGLLMASPTSLPPISIHPAFLRSVTSRSQQRCHCVGPPRLSVFIYFNSTQQWTEHKQKPKRASSAHLAQDTESTLRTADLWS